MVIAMSAGAGIRSCIAAVWSRPTQTRVPMHWALGLVALLAGGLFTTGDLSYLGSDRALHDTYYVVANIHYLLTLGAVFTFFAGWYYLFPKLTGRRYDEALGRLHFWLSLVGVGLMLLPPHFLALEIRRLADYPDAFAYANWWASVGSYLTGAGTLVFAAAMLHAWLRGRDG